MTPAELLASLKRGTVDALARAGGLVDERAREAQTIAREERRKGWEDLAQLQSKYEAGAWQPEGPGTMAEQAGYRLRNDPFMNRFAFALGTNDIAGKAAGALAGTADDASRGIRAYHGSPYDFDRFDMSKIGTGEGAQAYGHGLYFAEAEDVASGYRSRIAGADWVDKRGAPLRTNDIVEQIANEARKQGLDVVDAEKLAFRWGDYIDNPSAAPEPIKAVLERIGPSLKQKGRMYEVNIKANPDDFLDWDKPLSQQSDAWKKIASDWGGEQAAAERLGIDPSRATGRDYLNALVPQRRGEAYEGASRRLKDAGIPGIKYLDQGSRGAGDGTRNYVVFDDQLVEILKKYGLLGMIGGGAAGLATLSTDAQAQTK